MLSSMPCLLDLRLQIEMHRYASASHWRENEAVWVTPLGDLRSLRTFMLSKDLDLDTCQAYGLEFSRKWTRKNGWIRIR